MHDPTIWEAIAVGGAAILGLITGAFATIFHSGRQFGEVKTELHNLHGEMKGMRADLAELRGDFTRHLDKRA